MTDYDKEWKDLFGDIVIIEDGKVDPNAIPSYTLPDTITIGDATNYVTTNSSEWFTGNDTITLDLNDTFNNWQGYELWKDCMPSLDEVQKMCNEYPALKKAYENFKTIYKMVEQDYKGKQQDDS